MTMSSDCSVCSVGPLLCDEHARFVSLVVRVHLQTEDGSTHHRTYEQPRAWRAMSRQSFAEWALGNMIALVTSSFTDALDFDTDTRCFFNGEHTATNVVRWGVDSILSASSDFAAKESDDAFMRFIAE